MATKQEKAVKRAVNRQKKLGKEREEKHALGLLTAALLILLYLLFAQRYSWWPYAHPSLGSAFYTNVRSTQSVPADNSSAGSGGSSTPANSGTSGNNGSNGTSSGSSTTPITTFAAQVNVGDTKAETTTQASGLGQNCAVVATVNATDAGKQEVCTYTEGDKIVTVTYLNDRVISASKSGF